MDTTYSQYEHQAPENATAKPNGFPITVATPFGAMAVGCRYDGETWHYEADDVCLLQEEAARCTESALHQILWSFLSDLHWDNSQDTLRCAERALALMGIEAHTMGETRKVGIQAMKPLNHVRYEEVTR